jgi:WD40 repeat protein
LAIENLALIQRLKLDSELAAHQEIISSIRWDETGRLLVSASNDGFVNVWDMNKQARIVKNFSPGHPSGIYCAKVKPYTGAHIIVTSGADRSLKYADLLARTVHSYIFHAAGIRDFVFDPDCSNVFISGGEDGTIRQIDNRLPGSSPQQGQVLVDLRRQSKKQVQLSSHFSISTYTVYRTEVSSLDVNKYAPHQIVVGGSDPIVRVYDRRYLRKEGEEEHGCLYRFMPAEIKRVSSSFPFHRTVASVKFNHFGNQVLVNYNNDHIYLFDVDKNYSKYVKMKQAIVKMASEKAENKNNERKRKTRSEENSRVSPRKKRKTNDGEAVDADQTEEKSVSEEVHNVAEPTTEVTMDVDTNDAPNDNNNNINNARATSAFTSLLSRISGLVSRMAEYRPASNNINSSPNTSTDDNNQEENVDVDSREEPQVSNNTAETESSIFNINLEINETNEPQDENEVASNMPPLETTVTSVNFSEDEFRSISTAIASSNVSIDIPASRGDFSQSNNNDEPSDEASEASSTRFNLLGINNSIAQELESCETTYAMKFVGHKNMVTMKNAEFLGPHQEFVISGSDDGKLFIWSTATGKIVNVLNSGDNEITRVASRPNDLIIASTELFNKKVRLWRAVGENNNVNMDEIEQLAKKNIEQVESASRAEIRLPELVATFTNMLSEHPQGEDETNSNTNENNGEVNCSVM